MAGGGDFRVTGADDLERLGRRLKATGSGDLRKELLAGIRKTNKPTIAAIRAGTSSKLPNGGGMAAIAAKTKIGTRTRLSGQRVGVEIRGTSRQIKGLRALNAGRLRHPVWGNREVWVEQAVEPGFFSEPIEKDEPRIRRGIQEAMADIARKVERG